MNNFFIGVMLTFALKLAAAQSIMPVDCVDEKYAFDAKLYVGVPAGQDKILPPRVMISFKDGKLPSFDKRLSILKKCLILASKKYDASEDIYGDIFLVEDEDDFTDHLGGRVVLYQKKTKSIVVKMKKNP